MHGNNGINKCGEVSFPTLIICCVVLCPLFIPNMEMSSLIQKRWAIVGVIILLLVCVRSICLRKPLVVHPRRVLRSFLAFGIAEIIIAILQTYKKLPSYNSYFRFTGSFDNPAILAMLMSVCFPISLFYTIKSTGKNKKTWCFLTLCFALCLLLAESRTCIIAGVCSSFIIAFFECPLFRSYLSNRKVWLSALGGCVILLVALYYYKRDSADGRTLLWAVSLKMITEKPLLGWGADGFSASYMQHQAAFLLQHPESKLVYLADNVIHPFNEFLLTGVKYGLVGLSALFAVITVIFGMLLRIRDAHKSIYLSILLTLFILSMFSYPFMVPMMWLVSIFCVCSVVCIYCMDSPKMRIPLIMFIIMWISWLGIYNRHAYDEWRWRKVQLSSAPPETIRHNYAQLYLNLRDTPSFMYNYGAWLHHNGYYEESLKVLNECINSLDDYNVELLLADNYRQLGDVKESIERFEVANAMIPSKFLPLYHAMITYEEIGDSVNACRIARKIVDKPVKVQRSTSVREIIREAEKIISSQAK